MLDNLKFNYLKVFEVERGLEVGQKFINRNGFFSLDIWISLKKNLGARTSYSRRKIMQNDALFITIQILATSLGQNL